MQQIEQYRKELLEFIENYTSQKEPRNLYDATNYILKLGGKRLRPILTLMACDSFGKDPKEALNAAMCVEVFHNFTLIHDDIMDDAPLRRGKETVHEKWDLNTGILSGDAMLIMAYRLLEQYPDSQFKSLVSLFSITALEVCEGQQYDIDFEKQSRVDITDYLRMIEFKTAVLLGAAMQMGAIIANASEKDQKGVYDFGRYLGIAFQLQDDYLDAFGNPETFGKQIGGDIIENKKTFLYIKAIEFLNDDGRETLTNWYATQPNDATEKIKAVKNLFINSGAEKAIKKEVEYYTDKAFTILNELNIPEEKKTRLNQFGKYLMTRNT